jgi:hypothetical protein
MGRGTMTSSRRGETNLDARLLLTRTMPTLHPLYMALAMKLFMHEDLSPSDEDDDCRGDWGILDEASPFPTINGAISTRSESFAFSRRPCDEEPSSTSSMFLFALLGDRTDIPAVDFDEPMDISGVIFRLCVRLWVIRWGRGGGGGGF